jgi:hypothetical protein
MRGQQRKKPLVKDEPISAGTHQVAQKSCTTKIHKCLVPGTDNGNPPCGGGDGASSGVKKNGATANGTDNGTHHALLYFDLVYCLNVSPRCKEA